jgi:hypothetical protein
MGRRLSAVVIGVVSALLMAGTAFADTTPGPGNFRDSGSTVYMNAFATECGPATCTDTYINASATDLQHDGSFSSVCVEQFTYPIRGGGRFRDLFGCGDTPINVASDLSSGSVDATITGDVCGRRTCTSEDISVSLSLSAIADPVAYSYSSKSKFDNCTDTFSVKGSAADAEGTMVVNGSSLSAQGQIGAESFTFSEHCR